MTVELKDLIVMPDPGRVEVEKTLDFSATDHEGTPQAVTWSATGGSIESQDSDGIVTGIGTYTAFDEPGLYTVTATKFGTDISVTVEVEVLEGCNPIGTWRMREQDFLDQVSALAPEAGITASHLSGAFYVVFEGSVEEGGRVIVDRDNRTFSQSTPQGTITFSMSGTDTRDWTFDGATMSVNTTDSSLDISATLNAGSVQIALPLPDDVQTGPSFGSAECTANVMTSTVSEGGSSITVTLDKIS